MQAVETVARNLRRLRLLAGISQENLAVDAGVDRTYVSRLERQMENPTVLVLEKLAMALGAGISEFFEDIDPKEPLPPQLPRGRRKGS